MSHVLATPPSASRARALGAVLAHTVIAAYLYAMVWLLIAVLLGVAAGGLSPVLISGGSMGPAIREGDVILVDDRELSALGPGTVITFHDEALGGRFLTHRIESVGEDGSYVTKGDANEGPDSTRVAPADVAGYGRFVIPFIGLPALWARTGNVLPFVVWLATTAAAVAAVAPWRRRRGGAESEVDSEGDIESAGDGDGAPGESRGPWPPAILNPTTERSVYSVVGLIALVVPTLVVPGLVSGAAFSASTGNTGNSFAADTLEPPTGLGASLNGSDAIDLTWTPTVSTWADGYTVARSLSSGSGYGSVATLPGQSTASHTDTSLQPGNTNYYVAQAYAGGWSSTYSNEASATTAGYPDAQRVGTWGTGLSHAPESGSDRGMVVVAANEHHPRVRLRGTWGTGLTHTAAPGDERALVFIAGHEHGSAPAPQLLSVTYGGQSLTKVNGINVGGSVNARVEIWILDEAGLAAATGSTIVPTWDTSPDQPMYSHAFFSGVDQTTPISAQATNSSASATPNPITTAALTTSDHDLVVTGAVSGNSGTYTPQNGFSLGNNQTSAATTTLGTAYLPASAASATPSMQHSAPNRQVIAGAVLNASETPITSTLASLTYGGQPMTKVTGVSVGSDVTAATEIWFLDEAGIAAAADGTLSPTWDADTAPEVAYYSHAFYSGVDQSDPIGATGTNSSPSSTPNPLDTAALATVAGDIVVTGAFAGESGTYTPQNGFTLGNNQNSSPHGATLGTADKPAAAGTETPSMQHSAPDRQVIAGAVLNRRRAVLANTWTTGLTHAAGSGNDRLLVFLAGMENGADPGTPPEGQRDLTSVNYGGQALTPASEVMICTPGGTTGAFCTRVELWYLLESGIAAATDSTFVPVWAGDAPYELEEYYAAVTVDRVDQSAPIGNTSTNTSTSNPIQPTHPTGVGKGDLSIVAAIAGMGATYTPPAGYTEATDESLLSSTFATAYREIIADGTQQPTMTFDGTVNRQAVLAATIKTNGTL